MSTPPVKGREMALSRAEFERLAAFRLKLRQFLAFSEKASARVGLTQQQYQALLAMRAHTGAEPLTITDLAAEMLIKHHSAVGMVNRLEQQGMVRREPSSADRRKVALQLTDRGARVFTKLVSVHWGELRRIAPELELFFGHLSGGLPGANARRRARS
jgi:DNA-binding MarR family transcriptional regulator